MSRMEQKQLWLLTQPEEEQQNGYWYTKYVN